MLNLLNPDGTLSPRPFAEYDQYDPMELRMFCHHAARYGLPTTELIDYLKFLIGEHSAIEIGAGSGDMGRALGIRMTDNYMQAWPDVQSVYALSGQPTIQYGHDVERLDALAAVEKYRPHTVVASWVTHWIDPNEPPPPTGGNMYGIKEDLLLSQVKRYIVIGAKGVHQHKPIMQLPHQEIDAPFVRSRRTDNRIWIWKNE